MSKGKRNVFSQTGGAHPGVSGFDLSHEVKMTADMGLLYPVMCEMMMPGDIFHTGVQSILRCMPLVAPLMHEINMFFYDFFVPCRLMWDGFEDYITGGKDGDDISVLPRWQPTVPTGNAKGTLWDYFGFPTGVDPQGAYPMDFPRIAYNMVWNNYFRDENLQDEVDLDNEAVLYRSWMKDYFTAALLTQQRGTAPALPITGIGSAVWADNEFVQGSASLSPSISATIGNHAMYINGGNERVNLRDAFNANTIDFSDASTVDIAGLRLAVQLQRWMERSNRGGYRYIEWLQSMFGVHPYDETLQRPHFIGGHRTPIVISEVLQTSQTSTTPQGNLAGHGISVTAGKVGSYRAKEFGFIIRVMSIMPVPLYQQGIDAQYLYTTRYDWPNPLFVHLSEQAIKRAEIYADDVSADNNQIFGYIGRYDEHRYKRNKVVGDMRDTFDYWHLSRQFSSFPSLNESFIQCNPRKDVFAVPSSPAFMISVGNIIHAIRPLPYMSMPGYMDHG